MSIAIKAMLIELEVYLLNVIWKKMINNIEKLRPS